MAFGFSPNYSQTIPLTDVTVNQFLVIATEAAKKLGWGLGYITETEFVAYTKMSLVSFCEEVKVTITENNAVIKSECAGSQVMDWGKNKANVEKFLTAFTGLKNSLTPEEIDLKFGELKAEFPPEEESSASDSPMTTKGKIRGFFSLLTPVEGYFATPIIININILAFVLMALTGVSIWQPTTVNLLQWGANFRPLTVDGGWWRLITSCFLHIGILHLAMNMYALLYIGILLEPLLGRARFITAYLLTGLLSSVASTYWHEVTVSAGASGAIFGMYGVFLALLLSNFLDKAARNTLLPSISIFIIFNLLNGQKGGIDNAAHIGGFLSGLITGYAFIPTLKQDAELSLKTQIITMLIVVAMAISIAVIHYLPNDFAAYEKKMLTLVSMETMAEAAVQLPEGASKAKQIAELQNTGVYYWKECLRVLPELEALDVPEVLHNQVQLHQKYCEVQLRCYELQYKALIEDTAQYDEEIRDGQEQASGIMESLNGKLLRRPE